MDARRYRAPRNVSRRKARLKSRKRSSGGYTRGLLSTGDRWAPSEAIANAATDAAEQILGANPLIGIDSAEIIDAAQCLVRMLTLEPQVILDEHVALARELLSVLSGVSQLAPDPKDRR